METCIKRTAKTIRNICTSIACIIFSLLSVPAASAGTIVTFEDINGLVTSAKTSYDAFTHESLRLRMQYEYSGRFLSEEDKDRLHEIAKKASDQLEAIIKNQQILKQKIEEYEGRDWDARYGATGLWRRLSADIYTAILCKCEIDYSLALTAKQTQKEKILQEITARINSLNKIHDKAHSHFLKAKALTLLSREKPAYKLLATKEFDELTARDDIQKVTSFKAAIEKIKLADAVEPNQLNKLAQELAKSSCADDFELILPLAFLQRRYDRPGFEKTVETFPQTRDFIGSVILTDLSNRLSEKQDLREISVFEAVLATRAIWADQTQDHTELLDSLLNTDKFRTPLILYVSAVKFAPSSAPKAVELLVQASRLQKIHKSSKLDLEADKIAEQAAQLAYNLFVEDSNSCQTALQAFQNYFEIAGEQKDQQLEYIYSSVLNDCGRAEKSRELLQKIANDPAGDYHNRARLDLIVLQMHQNQPQRDEALEQLRDFIADCCGQDQNSNSLARQAVSLYCRTLLEDGSESSARKVLTILEQAETTGVQADLYKSKALQQLDRLDESAHHMLLATRASSGSLAADALQLLSEIAEKIDYLQSQANDFEKMMQECKELAEYCHKSLNGRQSCLILAEISLFAAGKEKGKLSDADKLLSELAPEANTVDLDFNRCRARLLCKQDRFEESGRLWAEIAKIRKAESLSNQQRSWKWWRAKFYELYCSAQLSPIQKEKVLHTIEVLESSFQDIPSLWAEKLKSLKNHCQNQLIDVSK